MRKRSLYPKTTRVGTSTPNYVVTEKLDGSNLVFYRYQDELYIAQRSTIFSFTEILESETAVEGLYRGLYQWILTNGRHLSMLLHNNAAICGEWIGMGHIKYGDTLPHRFYMFAKANYDADTDSLKNIIYDQSLFWYSFINLELPNYIQKVPVVSIFTADYPSITELDSLYVEYEGVVGRHVEGFVVYDINQNAVRKYVRRKGKTLEPHHS